MDSSVDVAGRRVKSRGEVPSRGEDGGVDQRLDHAAEQVAGVDRRLQQVGPGELVRGREPVADRAQLLTWSRIAKTNIVNTAPPTAASGASVIVESQNASVPTTSRWTAR